MKLKIKGHTILLGPKLSRIKLINALILFSSELYETEKGHPTTKKTVFS